MIRTIALGLAVALALPAALRADAVEDEGILKKAGAALDGPGLLKFLQGFTPRTGAADDLGPLVKQLGSEDFFEREEALKKVIAQGPRVAPYLRAVLKDADQELVRRAEECLKIVEGGPGSDVHGALLRTIALRKPAGAAAVVLEYIPFAPNERLQDESIVALLDVAMEGGKPAPGLLEALADKVPARRAAAAEVLAKVSYKTSREPLLALLKDGDPIVRLKAGQALILKHEKEAVPVLINLLEKLPPGHVSNLEILLAKLAEYRGPAGPFTSGKAMRDAWAAWWAGNEAKVDLTKLTAIPKLKDFTLLVHGTTGRLEEIDKDGKVRWQLEGLQLPVTAHYLGEDRVVVLETRVPRKITIRSLKGDILRSISVTTLATDVQVLPSGNILVCARSSLIEYNTDGGLVGRTTIPPGNSVVTVRKQPSGHMWCLTTAGQMFRLDATGKETARFALGFGVGLTGGGFEVTPEGRILVVDSAGSRVVELDVTGKTQREWKVPGATQAVRLPGGNTLVTCPSQEKVLEINERGMVVWEHNTRGSQVLRATRR